MLIIPEVGRQRQEDPWDSLASQHSLGRLQGRDLSQKHCRMDPDEQQSTDHWPLYVHLHMCACALHAGACPHMNTYNHAHKALPLPHPYDPFIFSYTLSLLVIFPVGIPVFFPSLLLP